MDERFGRLLALALEETDSIEEATVAAAIAYEHKAPEPLRTPPQPVDGQFALDIYDRRAQGILNRAMTAAKKLSAQARRDLAAALKLEPNQALDAVVRFLDRYRVQLANLLGTTQLAALLEGAREVAKHVPAIPPAGMDVVPPSLGPTEAVELVERLRGMETMEREQAIYALSPTEQRYVRQALGVVSAPPPPLRLPAPPAGPEGTHWPVISEAARSLAEKNVVTSAAFYQMAHAARAKAFAITGIDARKAVTKFRDALAKSAAEGPDYATFRKEILAAVGEAGLLSDHHLELVYRNAIQTAFSDGQMTVLSHPFVRSGFPYVVYEAIDDDRVRDDHIALESLGIDKTSVYRINDPTFLKFRPPWAHNCRCGWTPMTVKQAADRGIAEAADWLRTGVEPETKAWVTPPPFSPPVEFQRTLQGMPLSIQLSMVSAAEMLAPESGIEPDSSLEAAGGTPLVDPYYNMIDPKTPPKRTKTRKGRKRSRRRISHRLRTPDSWRVLSGGMAFSTDAPGPGWVSAGDGKWVKRGTPLGMIGDEWHGPTPPSPDWVHTGYGSRGGKVWRYKGSIGKRQEGSSSERVKQSLAAFEGGADIKTIAKMTGLKPNEVGDALVELRDSGQLVLNGTKYSVKPSENPGQSPAAQQQQVQQSAPQQSAPQQSAPQQSAPQQSPERREQAVAQSVAANPLIQESVTAEGDLASSAPVEEHLRRDIANAKTLGEKIHAASAVDTRVFDPLFTGADQGKRREAGINHNEAIRTLDSRYQQYKDHVAGGSLDPKKPADRERINASFDGTRDMIARYAKGLRQLGKANEADWYEKHGLPLVEEARKDVLGG